MTWYFGLAPFAPELPPWESVGGGTYDQYTYSEPVYEPPPGPAAYPHKCPVCNGEGKRHTRGTTAAMEYCPACKGACVLWG